MKKITRFNALVAANSPTARAQHSARQLNPGGAGDTYLHLVAEEKERGNHRGIYELRRTRCKA